MANRKSCFVSIAGFLVVCTLLLAASTSNTFADDLSDSLLWEIEVGDNLPTDRRPVISSVAISPSGERMAVVGDDHRIRIYSTEDRTMEYDIESHGDWVRAATFHPMRPELYTAGDDGVIRRMMSSGADMGQEYKRVEFPVRELVIRSDGTMAVGGFSDRVLIIDDKGETIRRLEYPGGDVRTLAFSPGGKYLAAGGRRGIVRLWDVETGKQLTEYAPKVDGPIRAIESIAFSSDGQLLAVGGLDRIVRIWNIKEGQLERELAPRVGAIRALTFCGSDRLVESRTSATGEHPIRVWNLSTGESAGDLVGHTGTVAVLLYDAPSGQLMSSGYDTTVRAWRMMDKPRLSPAERARALRLSMQPSEDEISE